MRRYGALAIGALVAVVCVRLGMWQLDRHEERRALNARVAERLRLPPVDLNGPRLPDSLPYRRARAHGVFDYDRQLVVVARSLGGIPGVHVVTPLLVGPGDAVLVERGYAPSPDGRIVDLAALAEPDTASVVGVVLRGPATTGGEVSAEQRWPVFVRRADPVSLAPRYPYALRPYVLRRTVPPATGSPTLTVLSEPEQSAGPHLSYAIQWFAFATIALVGSIVLAGKSEEKQLTSEVDK